MIVAIAALLLLLAIGLPVFLALGVLSAGLFLHEGAPLVAIGQIVLDKLKSPTLIAVPFFVVAAAFMQHGGVAKALIDLAALALGSLRGGLALVCIAATTVFAAISGSSVATAMAMGTVLTPPMLARGYPRPFALGVISASGTLGILVPPSIALILFGIVAEESVPRLFLAGVVPGILQALLFAAYVLVFVRLRGLAPEMRPPRDAMAGIVLRAIPAMSIPVIVFAGIYGGIVTVVEAAALAVVVAVLMSMFVFRNVGFREVPAITVHSVKSSAALILIVAGAHLFGHWITESGMPRRLVAIVGAAGLNDWQFLLVMNVLMLGLGMFLDAIAVILITLPLVLPVLGALEIDLVHYAIVVTVNMELAMLTPPIGLNLFVMAGIARVPVKEVIQGTLPFVALMLVLLVTLTFVPILSTWLPNAVMGAR